jgi:general secretion pathway protein A
MYERYFGLVDEPFRLTPDPRYLFLSPKHAEALAHLRLGLSESSGFVCITGDVGTGKTTLLRSFLGSLGPETSTAYIFDPTLNALELLRQINGEFGLPTYSTSKKALVDALNAHLLAQREAGRTSMVIIDEAQALGVEVLEQLRLLSNLETTTQKLLRIVLVGQPQLRALLLHPELAQLNQRITLRWHMGPLSFHETTAYVRHRLGVASGGQGGHLFTRPALRLVHRYSGGVPRLINMVAHRSMLAAFAADRRIVNARAVRKAYRELGAVPLPERARRPRRAAWAAVAASVLLALGALGGSQLVLRPEAREGTASVEPAPPPEVPPVAQAPAATQPPVATEAPAPTETPPALDPPAPAVVADAAPPAPPAPAEEPVAAPIGPEPLAPPAPTPPSPPAVDVASAPPIPAPAAPTAAVAGVSAPLPTSEVERRLAALDARASARASVQALLGAWRVQPLALGVTVELDDLAPVSHARGLEHLPLEGNGSMLRLLDLPAVLELRIPETGGPRYATIVGMESERWLLAVDGETVAVDPEFIERHWFGQAHLFWRDFEALGRTFGSEAHGVSVVRLQNLLRRAGAYDGPSTGRFDAATTTAVLDFQRARFLTADARVGRLTRIVLYAAAGGYPRPTLAAPTVQATS